MAAWCVVMLLAAVRVRWHPEDPLRALCSGSHSAVHNGPFTVDVLLKLNNDELLITDYAFDKIAD
jgi:hypothetical protein